MSQANQRIRNRVHFETEAAFEVDGYTIEGVESRDISMNGVFLVTPKIFPLGAQGIITITLTFGQQQSRVRAQAEVKRIVSPAESDAPGIGISFINLDTDSSLILYNIIKYQSQT